MTPQSIPTDAAVDSVSLRRHDEPFSVVGPWKDDVTAAGQVVFTAVHCGHDLRDEVRELMVLDEQDRFREEDPFTDTIAAGVGSGMVMHRSRFEVDLNRPRETCVYQRPEDCWDLDVWRDGTLPDDIVERSRQLHDAWFAELGRRLDVLDRRGPFVVFDVHSYNHRRDGADAPAAPGPEDTTTAPSPHEVTAPSSCPHPSRPTPPGKGGRDHSGQPRETSMWTWSRCRVTSEAPSGVR